jgi:hypothetical protein
MTFAAVGSIAILDTFRITKVDIEDVGDREKLSSQWPRR